ncbi:LysR family transcriptional regulator [Photobacterium sp. SDRW27]|uniref:LysR family transcriptional regulator n=1 Tax=Photobacterium obscurum TaxID=2829490 RepID=UPI0022445DCD|nr:LysR family transcriptional regulator [Photobacterium obscurum]MCW8327258.1 LysR family transcriptional regulator [Photobacterium obscurum]
MLLEGIETLLVLAKEGTMSKAGSQLYISQSAVSKRIARLEKRLGKKLIEPAGRHIKLTADAVALIDNVGPSYKEIKGLIFDQQHFQDHTLISLACSETLVAGYLGNMMGRYVQHDPFVTITTHHTPVIIEKVQAGDATIGFCAGHLTPQHGLSTRHLFDEPFSVISNQPLAQQPSALLVNDFKNPANANQASLLQKVGIIPLMEMDSYTASAQLALGGVAPALVPASIVKALQINPIYCHHFEFLDELTRPVHLCYRQNSYQSQRIRTLIETIADSVPKAI